MTKLTEMEKIAATMDVVVTYILEERGYVQGSVLWEYKIRNYREDKEVMDLLHAVLDAEVA